MFLLLTLGSVFIVNFGKVIPKASLKSKSAATWDMES